MVVNCHSLKLLNQTSGVLQLLLSPPRDARNVILVRAARWIWWAHGGCNLFHVCYFALKGCSPCHSDTGSDRHIVASYLTNLQTTEAHQLKVTRITLSTYSWTNKECFPLWLKFHSSRGTGVAELEGLWLPKWTNWGTSQMSQTKRPKRNPWVSCMLTFIPTLNIHKKDISDIIKWHHCHLLLHFGWEKSLHMCSQVGQTCMCICWHPQPISDTPPHMNHYVSFVPQFQCLWHTHTHTHIYIYIYIKKLLNLILLLLL